MTAGVVRVGDSVRRPVGPHSPFVHRLLRHLEARAVSGVPRFLGIDAQGREMLSFLPGDVPAELGDFTDAQLVAAAQLLRQMHDAAADSELRGDQETVCHGDPGPCNTVFLDGVPVAMIDFDAARPGPRRRDVSYAAWLWLSIGDERFSPRAQGRRLALFMRAYGASDLNDAVPAILAIQHEFAHRPDVPVPVRDWARTCRAWLERNLTEVNDGLENEGR